MLGNKQKQLYSKGGEELEYLLNNFPKIPDMPKEDILYHYRHINPIITLDGEKFYIARLTDKEVFQRPFMWEWKKEELNHVEEESIVFDNNQLVDQYNSLIDKLA